MTHVFRTSVAVLLLAVGACLIGFARWTAPIAEADAALAAGRPDRAVEACAVAEARFDALPPLRQLLSAEYARVVGNHLLALYRLGKYDAVIDLAQRAPAGAAPGYWSGSAFFRKAAAEEQAEARLGWLSRAEEEFRKAVEATPADWDTKYNFELITRLAAELRRQPNTPPRQMMQLLRPPQPGARTPRRTG